LSPKASGEGWGTNSSQIKGLSDSKGIFVVESSTEPLVTYVVEKEGYYASSAEFDAFKGVEGFVGFRKWQPWNPTLTIKLKKKLNPIPLYATKIKPSVKWPVTDQEIGYDLMNNDWVIPHGKGTSKDFIFKIERLRNNARNDYKTKFSLSFSNSDDGIMEFFDDPNTMSELKSNHMAPEADYNNHLVRTRERLPEKGYPAGHGSERRDQNYYFRIRTKLSPDGKIISALYGKIYGGFSFYNTSYRGKDNLSFTYYINPNENDRNLEFDPDKNLFKSLTRNQKAHKP